MGFAILGTPKCSKDLTEKDQGIRGIGDEKVMPYVLSFTSFIHENPGT